MTVRQLAIIAALFICSAKISIAQISLENALNYPKQKWVDSVYKKLNTDERKMCIRDSYRVYCFSILETKEN